VRACVRASEGRGWGLGESVCGGRGFRGGVGSAAANTAVDMTAMHPNCLIATVGSVTHQCAMYNDRLSSENGICIVAR
jgi:hypothetical protein